MVEDIEYIERKDNKNTYIGDSFWEIRDDSVDWGKMRNILAFTDWIFDGHSSSPKTEYIIEICDKLVEEYELTVSVDVSEYNDKELTLIELQIEEDISIGSEYAEARQFLVDRFEKRFGYSINLSGEIKQVAT